MSETLMTEAAPTEGATSQAAEQSAANQQPGADTGVVTQDTKPASDSPQGNESDAKDGEGSDDKGESKGAPEEYADFTLPEGIELGDELTGELKAVAKELNLTQEQAQKLADLAASRTKANGEQQTSVFEAAKKQWAEDAKADKEIGGSQFAENLSIAKKALDTFGTPELRTLLRDSGLGNHPEIIKAFVKAGKSISEDRIVPAGAGGQKGSRVDPARSLYPNQPT